MRRAQVKATGGDSSSPSTNGDKKVVDKILEEREVKLKGKNLETKLRNFEKTLDMDNPLQLDLYSVVTQNKDGTYFLVKWEGSTWDVSWEPESSVPKKVIREYREALEKSSRKMVPKPEISLSKLPHPVIPFFSEKDAKVIPELPEDLKNFFLKSKDIKEDEKKIITSIGEIQRITPEYILEKVKDDGFVSSLIENLQSLYEKKAIRYTELFNKTFDPSSSQGERESGNKNEFSIKPYLREMTELALEKSKKKISIEDMRKRIIEAVTDRKNGILSLTSDARKGMRDFLATQIYVLSRSMAPFNENFLNIALMGPPGTGKTKLASVLAFAYGKLGILLKNYPNNIIVGSAKDVVASFAGQTVNKTNKFLGLGLECIIFIDEAYSIMACGPTQTLDSDQAYGPEAISEIVNFLDVYRGLSILVVAGYEKAMENCFFGANQGLSRRFPFQYKLVSYSSNDLTAQFINVVNDRFGKIMFTERDLSVVKFLIKRIDDQGWFPNQAGDISNLAAIFATTIDSFPGFSWGESEKVDVFMLSQVYKTYSRGKKPITQL